MAFHWTKTVAQRQGRQVSLLLALVTGVFLGAPGFATPAFATTVERIDVADGRVTIRFDEEVVHASTALLAGPDRITVDIAGARPGRASAVQGKVGQDGEGHDEEGQGDVTRIRQGWLGRDGTRIVLDLARPFVVGSGTFGDDGRTLELTLKSVARDRFERASMAAPLEFLGLRLGAARPTYKVSIPVPPAKKARLPRVDGDADRPLVVIDAGHGGVDPGAINAVTGLREKDVTLKVAQAIRDALLATGKVRVALTRNDDRYLVLRERFGIARRLRGDLFLSIHCDSAVSEEATGASIYTLSEVASDKESARLAARENKADVIAGVNLDEAADVSSILIDLTQRETMNQSAGFARLLGREAPALMGTKANFHRMASLMVLKAPDMPSALFETGYISNPRDAAFLDSREGRARIAQSVTRAVDVFFARRMAQRMAMR